MEHATLGSLLEVQDDLQGQARAARPARIRWLISITNKVSWVLTRHQSSAKLI